MGPRFCQVQSRHVCTEAAAPSLGGSEPTSGIRLPLGLGRERRLQSRPWLQPPRLETRVRPLRSRLHTPGGGQRCRAPQGLDWCALTRPLMGPAGPTAKVAGSCQDF